MWFVLCFFLGMGIAVIAGVVFKLHKEEQEASNQRKARLPSLMKRIENKEWNVLYIDPSLRDNEEQEMSTMTMPEVETRSKILPPYNVILLNDDDHSFQYVIAMMQQLFGHPQERGKQIAEEVHLSKRAVVVTTSKERAELKQEQIHAFGPDPLIERCQGSMSCVIEPAY